MTPFNMLPFVGLGAVAGLDVVSFPQAMISRPIVAATVAGAFAGDAERGMMFGAVLEMVVLGTLPFGASRYPEWGSASVIGGALYASGVAAPSGHLALAVLGALIAAWASGESMIALRKFNARLARRARALPTWGSRDQVNGLQMTGLVGDLLRGAAVTAIGLAILAPAYTQLAMHWHGGAAAERAIVAGLTAALGAATIWMLVRGTSWTRALIVAGLAVGVAVIT